MHTELGRSQVEVLRCTLSWEVGEELGDELARRKWRWKSMQAWKLMQTAGGGGGGEEKAEAEEERARALIKSNNTHLAGGEKQFAFWQHFSSAVLKCRGLP